MVECPMDDHKHIIPAAFDWLEKKCYISINCMSKNLRTIFLPLAPKMCNNVDENILMTKLEL